jgi:hypothetical protein
MVTPESSLALRSWIAGHGGGFHPDTHFVQGSRMFVLLPKLGALPVVLVAVEEWLIKISIDSFGSHVIAAVDLPKDSTIVSCPFELVITRGQTQRAVLETLGINEKVEVNKDWTERQWISTYLSLHSIAELKDERYSPPD